MTDRKQEAIDKIQEELCRAWAAGRCTSEDYNTLDKAKALYARIAPLIRGESVRKPDKFPEKAFRRFALRYRHERDKWLDDRTKIFEYMFNQMISDFKRLWEDAPTWEFPDEAMKNLLLDADLLTKEGLFWKIKCLLEGDHIAEVGKKVCQKCRGSGEVQCDPIRGDLTFRPEPYRAISPRKMDCPQCDGTGECQHKNVVESLPGMLYCRDCR